MKKHTAIMPALIICLTLTACNGGVRRQTEGEDPSEAEELTAAEAAQASYETEETLSDEEFARITNAL